jgi:hypothetical protein
VPSVRIPATGPPATTTRWEIERDGEVYSRSRSHPAPYDDCSRPASYDRILMTGIEIGIGIAYRPTDGADDGYARVRVRTGGDGEKERERGKGKRRRAEHDVTEDRPGRGGGTA